LKDTGADANEIQLAEYDLEIEQLKYDHIKESLDDYNVYAPCDGELKLNQNGQLNINSPVYKGMVIGYTIDKTQKYLCASIHNTALNNVNFGTLVTLQQGANSATGMVTDIIYVENGDYSTYNYVITPDENDFLDSEPISVIFDVYSREDTVVIPAEAVKTLSDRTYVNLLVDGVKIEQDIELGIENGDSVEVISGLSGDEEIILN
jgi:triacylglycerol esterase/lipase EstA (alpha/beta hydrolase family)